MAEPLGRHHRNDHLQQRTTIPVIPYLMSSASISVSISVSPNPMPSSPSVLFSLCSPLPSPSSPAVSLCALPPPTNIYVGGTVRDYIICMYISDEGSCARLPRPRPDEPLRVRGRQRWRRHQRRRRRRRCGRRLSKARCSGVAFSFLSSLSSLFPYSRSFQAASALAWRRSDGAHARMARLGFSPRLSYSIENATRTKKDNRSDKERYSLPPVLLALQASRTLACAG